VGRLFQHRQPGERIVSKSWRRERTDRGQSRRMERQQRNQRQLPQDTAEEDREWDEMEPLFPWGMEEKQHAQAQ